MIDPNCDICRGTVTPDYAFLAPDPCPKCNPEETVTENTAWSCRACVGPCEGPCGLSRCEAVPVQHAAPETKPTNPKDAIGSDKLPVHLWPTTATVTGSLALLDGALKYGRSNFREIGVRASIYYDAAMRHLMAWVEGEDNDPDSGVPHLGHVLACVAILIDAQAAGKLNDDRAVRGGYRKLVEELTPHVKRLKALHASKAPKHYTIADNR